MLKTIRRDEFKLMKKMLSAYYDHLTVTNPDSLISKIYGLHKVIFYRKKHKMQKKLYFCIMNNVFNTGVKIDYRYDLKGSTLGRTTESNADSTIALKDLDFLKENKKFLVGRDFKNDLIKILKKDADFFAK
jgi:1-phosphatidylinositol-4-phosphate 5-kinase